MAEFFTSVRTPDQFFELLEECERLYENGEADGYAVGVMDALQWLCNKDDVQPNLVEHVEIPETEDLEYDIPDNEEEAARFGI